AARARGLPAGPWQRAQFIPFDPSTKQSESVLRQGDRTLRVTKGAPQVITALATGGAEALADVDRLAAQGYRVLAVAAGPEGEARLAGLVALRDPPREDSRTVVQSLGELGVRVLMVTGDGPVTARAVADSIGIEGKACLAEDLHAGPGLDEQALECGVFAGVLPEDKFHLVRAFQRAGSVVGMTGDGVNDA